MTTLCKETMINSYNGISFYGERRGAEDYSYYTELLKRDLEELREKNGSTGNYEEKFIDKVMTIYHRQMSCTSAFIVGPANYNLRRHEKAWASRDKAYSDFEYWRAKYFKAVNRERTLSPEEEIEKAVNDIDKLIVFRDRMKEANKIIKKYKLRAGLQVGFEKTEDEKEGTYELLEISGEQSENEKVRWVNSVLTLDCFGSIGFASYTITSATTKIRERKKKIEIMKSRIEAKESQEEIFFNGGSIFIENDRVIIKHDEKPEREIIQQIKSNGFRWSPKFKSWCRKHTANARRDANYLLNNVFGGKVEKAA